MFNWILTCSNQNNKSLSSSCFMLMVANQCHNLKRKQDCGRQIVKKTARTRTTKDTLQSFFFFCRKKQQQKNKTATAKDHHVATSHLQNLRSKACSHLYKNKKKSTTVKVPKAYLFSSMSCLNWPCNTHILLPGNSICFSSVILEE